jgi:hypothetical protein
MGNWRSATRPGRRAPLPPRLSRAWKEVQAGRVRGNGTVGNIQNVRRASCGLARDGWQCDSDAQGVGRGGAEPREVGTDTRNESEEGAGCGARGDELRTDEVSV